MIYFTSDTHFHHYLPALGRPFADERMDDLLVDNWNSKVKSGDTIWHLGDFALHSPLEKTDTLFKRLNGDKHLVMGNHDHNNKNQRLRWASVHDTHMLKVDDHQFWLAHYAHRVWPSKHYGVFHLYGHSHGHLPGLDRSMDVGVDVLGHDFSPISLEYVLDKLKDIEFKGKYD